MKKALRKLIYFVIFLTLFYSYLEFDTIKETVSNKIDMTEEISIDDSGEINVYFCPRDKCEQKLEYYFSKAEKSLSCAFFDYELDIPIPKGIDTRFVFDDEYQPEGFEYPNMNDNHDYLMHNKFCIIDDEIVLTGSYNPTERGTYFNNNNLVIINSVELASIYNDEFEEMWAGTFHKGEKARDHSGKVTAHFCPEDDCEGNLIRQIEQAEQNIRFLTFSFTSDAIADALHDAMKRGVSVAGIFERSQNSQYSKYNYLKQRNMPVYIDTNSYNLHHKFFVIDEETVITGSYNPTNNGNKRNDENMIIINDNDIVARFLDEFEFVMSFDEEANENKAAGEVIISHVEYNPEGKDEGKEYFEITAKSDVDLEHFYYDINEKETRMNGSLRQNESAKFFTYLRNTNGTLILRNASREQIDIVHWD